MQKNINQSKKEIISISLLEKLGISENSGNKGRERGDLIYNYPEGWNKYNINGIEGKSFRSSCRKKIMGFADRIILFREKKRLEDMNKEIKDFMIFYREKYRINDFNKSLFAGMRDERERMKGEILFEICIKSGIAIPKDAKKGNASAKGIASKEGIKKGDSEKNKLNAEKRKMNKDAKKKNASALINPIPEIKIEIKDENQSK